MTYVTGFHQAASLDATRIAQTVLQKDVQTQVVATTGIKRDTQHARRIPEAERTAKQRERFKRERDGERAPAGEASVPRMPGTLLDFLA